MTKLLPFATYQNSGACISPPPGAAPLGTGAMQGNPSCASYAQNDGQYPPQPLVGPNQGLANIGTTPASHDLIARGHIPLNAVPSNQVNAQPGTQSLLALIATGQVSLNQTTYGQPASVGGRDSGTQYNAVVTATPQQQPAQDPSRVTVAAAPNYMGD